MGGIAERERERERERGEDAASSVLQRVSTMEE